VVFPFLLSFFKSIRYFQSQLKCTIFSTLNILLVVMGF
jgi:hypothetical protein